MKVRTRIYIFLLSKSCMFHTALRTLKKWKLGFQHSLIWGLKTTSLECDLISKKRQYKAAFTQNSSSCVRETIKKTNLPAQEMVIYRSSKQTKTSLNYMPYLELKCSQSQTEAVIKCSFCCNSKGNEPVSLERWGVMKLISISQRGNLTDQKTWLKVNQ